MSNTTHVYVIAGQSNAAGQGGQLAAGNLPGQTPQGEDLNLVEDYGGGMLYTYSNFSKQDASLRFEQDWGDLKVRSTNNRVTYLFGPEMTLGRVLNSSRPTSWGECDKVALIKIAAGGTSLTQWSDGSFPDLHGAFIDKLSQRISELRSTGDTVVIHDIFWVQGEADARAFNNLSSTYADRFAEFMKQVNCYYSFRPIFSLLKDSALSEARTENARILNQSMIDAGYITTVDNNDLVFLDQTPIDQHYNAASQLELGRRLARASLGV